MKKKNMPKSVSKMVSIISHIFILYLPHSSRCSISLYFGVAKAPPLLTWPEKLTNLRHPASFFVLSRKKDMNQAIF